jgi:large subunit ribosomal protein L15
MTNLSNLKNTNKVIKRKKTVGRGSSSGKGKTCTRGNKGYGSRRGSTKRLGYEGGQKRLYTKLPRKGFNRGRFKKPNLEINLSKINEFYKDDEVVNFETLFQKGLMPQRTVLMIKILGKGELDKKVKIEANYFSKGALKKLDDKKIQYKEIK